MIDDVSRQLQQITDREEIHRVLCRYCDALDHRRWDLLDDVFTADVVSHWPPPAPDAPARVVEGRDAVLGFIQTAFTHLGATHHQLGNLAVDLDGDTAQVAVRVRAHHLNAHDPSAFEESLATFTGTATRTPDGWRFTEYGERILIMLGGAEAFAPPAGS